MKNLSRVSIDEINHDLSSNPIDYEIQFSPEELLADCQEQLKQESVEFVFDEWLGNQIEPVRDRLDELTRKKLDEVIKQIGAENKAQYLEGSS